MDIKQRIDGLEDYESELFTWRAFYMGTKGGAKMNGGYIPLCPEMYKGDKDLMGVRPLPCVRDEHGEIREQTIKQHFSKINEELDELKQAVFFSDSLPENQLIGAVAEEACDTITAITTMLEALGIDAEMRDEAQRRVNDKNRERGRL